jgi:hypothetical protein
MRRPTTWLAWTLCVMCIVFTGLGFILELTNRSTTYAGITQFPATLVMAVLFPFVGALIAARHPGNPIGWIFCGIGLSEAITTLAGPYAIYTLVTAPGALPGGALMSWIVIWLWLPGFVLLAFLLLLFPSGRLLSPRWSWAGWCAGLGTLLVVLNEASAGWPLRGPDLIPYFSKEFAGGTVYQAITATGAALIIGSFIAAIISLVLRFRRSRGVERQQLKWFTYTTVLAALVLVVNIVMNPFVDNVNRSLLNTVLAILEAITFATIPVAVGIAVLTYRLYDIDIIIRRTLVYSILTVTLGLVYIGCILLSRALVAPLTGGSELAIVASTLAIAALFNPLRHRIQQLIDKRFYRRKYDAAKVLAAFGATVRDETDLERLTGELLRVVDETMQPEFVGLWLRDTQVHSTTEVTRPDSPPQR